MSHPVLTSESVAVVTAVAAGIGLASAIRFARLGVRVGIADLGRERLAKAAEVVAAEAPGGKDSVMAVETDASRFEEVRRLDRRFHDGTA